MTSHLPLSSFFTEKTQKCPARSLIHFKNVFSLSMSVLFWWSGGELLVGWFCSETTTSIDKGFLSKAAARLKQGQGNRAKQNHKTSAAAAYHCCTRATSHTEIGKRLVATFFCSTLFEEKVTRVKTLCNIFWVTRITYSRVIKMMRLRAGKCPSEALSLTNKITIHPSDLGR